MITTHVTRIAAVALTLASASHGSHDSPAGTGSFSMEWRTIDCGGGTSHGASFTLVATIGQPDTGAFGSGPFVLVGGFWAAAAGPALPPSPDLNGDGIVDGADLGMLLSAWGTAGPLADLDLSGFVDGADLGLLLAAWGGGGA